MTFDWQTVWTYNKQWSITGGVLNLTNQNPPLSISHQWLPNRGQQFGYDDRYYGPAMRPHLFYVNVVQF